MRPANNDPVKQCLIIYRIRMDTLETQTQFGLWRACHSFSRLKSLIQRDSDPKRASVLTRFPKNCVKQYPQKSWTISEPSTSSFTSQRNPPPRPWLSLFCTSTSAFASRSRSTTESWPLSAARCSGVWPREPQPEAKPRAEPNGTKGRKIRRNVFWCHSISSLDLTNTVVLRCLEDIELVQKTVACGVLSKPCQPCLQSRCTWINSNILQLYQTNLPMIGKPHHLKIIARFCSIAPGISFNWPNKQWQEKETSVWIMRPAEIQLSQEFTSEWKLWKPRNSFWIAMRYKNPSIAKGPTVKSFFFKNRIEV